MSKIYDSDYSVRLATLGAMGGDTTKCYDSTYEIDLAILDIIEHGGGGGAQIDDDHISTETTWSSSKIVTELADAGFNVLVVQELPATGEAHTLYFVPSDDPQTQNAYDEYLYANNAWEQVGSTAVDMSDYYTADEVDALLDDKAEIVEITQAEYDLLTPAEKNNGKIYSITDATVIDMNNYYTKTQADARYNPYNTTTARTSGYRFPIWNARGQITGEAAAAYTFTENINGTSKTVYGTATGNLPTIYAPTSAGTAGQYLTSNGSGAPIWKDLEVASDYVISDADASAGTYSTDIANFYSKTIDENIVQGVQIKIVNNHSNYEVSTNEAINLEDGSIFAVAENAAVTIRLLVNTRAGEQYKYIEIAADGTIDDTEAPGTITANALSITGYNIYQFNDLSDLYIWQGFDSGIGYAIDIVSETSDSYYLPSSSRIYEGNVELWLMSTEDGQSWENIHYLITGNSITRDVTTGTFGQ